MRLWREKCFKRKTTKLTLIYLTWLWVRERKERDYFSMYIMLCSWTRKRTRRISLKHSRKEAETATFPYLLTSTITWIHINWEWRRILGSTDFAFCNFPFLLIRRNPLVVVLHDNLILCVYSIAKATCYACTQSGDQGDFLSALSWLSIIISPLFWMWNISFCL